MKPYVVFKISGISGEVVSEDVRSFTPENDEIVEEVTIIQTDSNIEGLRFDLKESVNVNECVISKITKKAKDFIVNICCYLHPSISKFDIKLDRGYDPNEEFKFSDRIVISENVKMIHRHKEIVSFKKLFEHQSQCANADNVYMLLYNIFRIDNIAVRYLMQYELLLSLVAPNRRQKEVFEYIKNTYNPANAANASNVIGFQKTRKKGQEYDEDDITYYRNLLAHNDDSEKVNENTIISSSEDLARVLFFVLNPEFYPEKRES